MITQVPLRQDRCENCRHFAPEVFRELPPTCRINPPVGGMAQGPHGAAMIAVWTPTKPEYWCNKWEAFNDRDIQNLDSLGNDS